MTSLRTHDRLARYALVGLLATFVHYVLMVCLVEGAALAPPAAGALGAVVGAQVAFVGNAALTFRDRRASPGAWLRFQVAALVAAATSFLAIAIGTRLGAHYLVSQGVATMIALFLGFEINRRWSFGGP